MCGEPDASIDSQLLPSSKFRSSITSKYLINLNKIIASISHLIGDWEINLTHAGKGIDIEVFRGKEKVDYRGFSGGEKRRIDIVMIFSLIKFVIDYSGIESNLIVFDEIFDGVDFKGMELIFNIIDSMFSEDKCVYIVTHRNEFKSMFSSQIKVVKSGGVSRIEG